MLCRMDATDGDRGAYSPDDLRAVMDDLGLHQAALARIVAVGKGAPTRWLSGEVPVPPWLMTHLQAMQSLRELCRSIMAPQELPASSGPIPARLQGLPVFHKDNTSRQAVIALTEHGSNISAMESSDLDHAMSPEDFREALSALGWPQRQFAVRVGVTVGTANRWAQGVNPIPAWVGAHLGLLLEIQRLHGAFVAVQREKRGT